jgi:hypothetical protein
LAKATVVLGMVISLIGGIAPRLIKADVKIDAIVKGEANVALGFGQAKAKPKPKAKSVAGPKAVAKNNAKAAVKKGNKTMATIDSSIPLRMALGTRRRFRESDVPNRGWSSGPLCITCAPRRSEGVEIPPLPPFLSAENGPSGIDPYAEHGTGNSWAGSFAAPHSEFAALLSRQSTTCP